MQAQTTVQNRFINSITQGDCIQVMREMPANSVDFILTDPPYLVNYRDRDGRTIQNDAKAEWLKPAMREAFRVLKQNRVAVMYYGWTKVDAFFEAWKEAGFRPVGHIVFRKAYSSKRRFFNYQHEQAYLLAKGRPPLTAFYKKALGRYGDVIVCQDNSPLGSPAATSEGLTCADNKDNRVQVDQGDYRPGNGGLELKAGSRRHQHIVGFENPRNGQTRFAMVALDLPAAADSSSKESD